MGRNKLRTGDSEFEKKISKNHCVKKKLDKNNDNCKSARSKKRHRYESALTCFAEADPHCTLRGSPPVRSANRAPSCHRHDRPVVDLALPFKTHKKNNWNRNRSENFKKTVSTFGSGRNCEQASLRPHDCLPISWILFRSRWHYSHCIFAAEANQC